jgi:hypothetical protein
VTKRPGDQEIGDRVLMYDGRELRIMRITSAIAEWRFYAEPIPATEGQGFSGPLRELIWEQGSNRWRWERRGPMR